MAVGNIKSKYLCGVIKAGFPFAVINLAIVCAIYLLLIELGHISSTSSSIAEMRPGANTSDLSRTNELLLLGDMLTLAVSPAAAIIASTFAGIASASINAIRDEKEAEVNGMLTGSIMWSVVMIAGSIYFSSFIVHIVSAILQRFDVISLFLLSAIILLPVILILWVFIHFSTIGSNIFVRANSPPAFSIGGVWAIAKTSLAKGARVGTKVSVNTAMLAWIVLLFCAIAIWVFNMH